MDHCLGAKPDNSGPFPEINISPQSDGLDCRLLKNSKDTEPALGKQESPAQRINKVLNSEGLHKSVSCDTLKFEKHSLSSFSRASTLMLPIGGRTLLQQLEPELHFHVTGTQHDIKGAVNHLWGFWRKFWSIEDAPTLKSCIMNGWDRSHSAHTHRTYSF